MTDELIERLEKATGPDRELDADLFLSCEYSKTAQANWRSPPAMPLKSWAALQAPEYTNVIEHANRLNPGWFWRVGSGAEKPGWAHLNRLHLSHCDRCDEAHGDAASPAIALCIAALKAREHQIGGE